MKPVEPAELSEISDCDRLMCPHCYARNKAWSMGARCAFCGARGKPASEVYDKGETDPKLKSRWPTWQSRLHYIALELAGRSQQRSTPVKPSDRLQYTPEELRAVIAYEMPSAPKSGSCDWCGKPWKTREKGPRVCNRCWSNREQIEKEIGGLTRDMPSEGWDVRLEVARAREVPL